MNLTILKLQYFIDVADLGSFTKAGAKNHVAQASISQQVHELEAYFSCQLFNHTKPVTLTEAGQVLYHNALKTVKQFQQLRQVMEPFANVKRPVKIAYASLLDLRILDRLLGENKLEYTVQKEKLSQLASKLKQGVYDFAVAFDSAFVGSDLTCLDLAQGKYQAAVSLDHPLAPKMQVTLEEIYQYPWVMLTQEALGKSRQIMLKRSQERGFTPLIASEASDIESELFLIKNKKLLGFFTKNDAQNLQHYGIKLLDIIDSPHRYHIFLAYPKKPLSKEQTAFLNQVKQHRQKLF